MRTFALSILIGVLATAFLFPIVSPATAAMELEISAVGLRNTKGNILVVLYRDAETFLDEDFFRYLVIPADQQPPTGVIRELPEGEYAIAVLHDENSNNKLDKRFFLPREGFGFSNNMKVRVRAPSFDEAKFTVTSGRTRLEIELQYR